MKTFGENSIVIDKDNKLECVFTSDGGMFQHFLNGG